MNGLEIQKQIIENYKIIEEEAGTGLFTLNKRAQAAREEINRLRGICPHQFNEIGYCIYCDKEVD